VNPARRISRLIPIVALLLLSPPLAAQECIVDLKHSTSDRGEAGVIHWEADAEARGFCRVAAHYAVLCQDPSDADCSHGLKGIWGNEMVRVPEFVFNEAGKFALVAVTGTAACNFAEDETRYLRLDGATCIFRPADQ